MRILYVALKYDYADEARGFSFEHINFYDTLIRLYPDQVIYFAIDEEMKKHGSRQAMNVALLATVKKEQPDILFSTLYTNEISPHTLRRITQETKTITINWFSDDQWRFDNFSRFWAPLFDWVITTDPNSPAKYEAFGYKNNIKTTWAANVYTYKPVAGDRTYGVTFVGRPHGNRRQLVAALGRAGIVVECFGAGWKNGRVSQEKMVEIFSNSKINLNFAEVSTAKRDLKTIVKSIAKIFFQRGLNNSYHWFPLSVIWRNLVHFRLPKSHPQIKGRNFEVPACGGFLLTQAAEDLYRYYEYGKEIAVFQTEAELIEKVRYYLAHDFERTQIAASGYNRTIREHTWEKRFQDIISKVVAGGKRKTL